MAHNWEGASPADQLHPLPPVNSTFFLLRQKLTRLFLLLINEIMFCNCLIYNCKSYTDIFSFSAKHLAENGRRLKKQLQEK